MAGEQQDLVTALRELAQDLGGSSRAAAVEIHEHIVEDQRQHDTATREISHQRQPQTQEYRFPRATTQHIERQRLAGRHVHT